MKRIIFSFIFLFNLVFSSQAQSIKKDQPKLVVGIVIDQMRQEYLYRFEGKFGEGGFKRLMKEGFMLKNAHYNYAPTCTGPGHASIYTGATPSIHGIIGNEWYDKELKKKVNCVEDGKQKPIGSDVGKGDISPWRLLSSTITDELELATQRRAKVIGISMKDRGAVLPAGHTPDGAYWYDGKTGKFITSTYYKAALPLWVDQFNELNLADTYLNQEWKTILPIDQYVESGPDDTPYETKFAGKEQVTFPYNLKELRKLNGNFDLIKKTPFANDLLTDLAKATLLAEAMGKDEWTDFLTVSYSATDVLGHADGPNSIEIEDMYIRLDKNMEDLLNYLDKEIGSDKYTVFLTSDHGVADIPQYLKDLKIPAGKLNMANLEVKVNDFLQRYYPGKKVIESISNEQVFLNQELFTGDPKSSGIDLLIATELISKFLISIDGIAEVYTEGLIRQGSYSEGGGKGMVIRGFHTKRSGDLAFSLQSGWTDEAESKGTGHGSSYTYDTHVPVLFYGVGIKKGSSSHYHTITDIAPTLSVLLKIKFPSGCTGQPIVELLD